jgi:hypothetical protein
MHSIYKKNYDNVFNKKIYKERESPLPRHQEYIIILVLLRNYMIVNFNITETCIIVNFNIHKINQDMHKLT